jgi:CRISPR-associated protein Csx10
VAGERAVSVLHLTLKQPAQVGDRARSDAVLSTLRYLPGGVVRGALAATWLAAHGEPGPGSPAREEFLALFEGQVRYGPLFAGNAFPCLSVLSHKYPCTPGCAYDDLDEVDHPDVGPACPDCGTPWEATTTLDEPQIRVRRRTSVAIGSGGVAERGRLFSRDTLPIRRQDGAPLVFSGHLVAADPDLLARLAALGHVRIGGRRTTHGLAAVTIDETGEIELPQRLDPCTVVLRLRSPAVFVDEFGRPAARPGERELLRWFGPGTEVRRRWVRWQTIGGWHAASGLPKPAELAVSPGSTYVIRAGRPVPDDVLRELARHGVGLRRHEGFGDLGGSPALRPGRIARVELAERQAREQAAEQERVRGLADAVAPVRAMSTTTGVWASVVALLVRHAEGDASATGQLTRLTLKLPDRRAAAALERLLGYPPADVVAVLGSWGER